MSYQLLLSKFLLFTVLWLCDQSLSLQKANAQSVTLEVPTSFSMHYHPFSGQPAQLNIPIKLSRNNSEDINENISDERVIVRLKSTHSNNISAIGNQAQLPVFIQSSLSQLNNHGNEYLHEINLNKELSKPTEFEYQLNIPSSVYANAGTYTIDLEVAVLDENLLDSHIITSKNLEIKVVVDPKIHANIAGKNGINNNNHFSVLDFGVLQSGDSKQILVQVRGNTSSEIKISSENNGYLKHTKKNNLKINYSIKADGVFSELKTPLEITRKPEKNLQGSMYPIKITIGEVSNSFSGIYQDIMHIDVMPQ